MLYGYARCSTNESKQDVERQKRELRKMRIQDSNIFFEYESGTKADRVQLERLLATVNAGDTIATTEVSRLTRSTKQLCDIIEQAKEKRLELIIGTFKVDCRNGLDPMTDGMLKMMGVFAEMERNMISQRVKSGMENAKAKGSVLGRPETTVDNLPADFIRHYPKYTAKQLTQAELARLCNISRQSVNKYIKIYKTAGNAE
ncbi:MAG: recombinase family protein [Defluviitaleaceae bacterium]|nr:recombinase family protein [Defluviitaleaceae bacterium]